MATDILKIAKKYISEGFSIVRVRYGTNTDDDKRPDVEGWKQYQERQPTEKEVEDMFGDGKPHNIALIGGKVSGNAVFIDFDSLDAYKKWLDELRANHPKIYEIINHTRVVKSARGFHIYLRFSDERFMLPSGKKPGILDIQGEGKYVLAPPSRHPTGIFYDFFNYMPVYVITERAIAEELAQTLNTVTRATREERKTEEIKTAPVVDAAKYMGLIKVISSEWREGTRYSLIMGFAGVCRNLGLSVTECADLVDIIGVMNKDIDNDKRKSRLIRINATYAKGPGERYATKEFFDMVDPELNNKIDEELRKITLSYVNKTLDGPERVYAKKGQLVSARNGKIIIETEEKDEPEPDEVPQKVFVKFKDLYEMFEGTHAHLGKCYDMVERELQLEGDAYYAMKKALCYYIESLRQPTYSFFVGAIPCDNRIHMAFILPSGRGKGQIKKTITQYSISKYSQVSIFPATSGRVNVEQLIGRIYKEKGKPVEERGYLGYKGIVADECQDLIAEEQPSDTAVMLEFRNAMEVYHKNTVQKKLTSEEMMSYDPEGRFLLLLHYPNFPAVFFDRGTARRLFVFEAGTDSISEDALISGLFGDLPTSEFKEYLNIYSNWPKDGEIYFDKEAVDELALWINNWGHWTLTHPNQRVRALGQKNFTSVKNHFIRMCAILTLKKNEPRITKYTIAQACFDTIHFLLCTYEVYANESSINLSRDVWRTVDPKEAMLFEWMHYNKATSAEASKLSIMQVQKKIGELLGLHDRQAISVFAKLVESGHIGRWKGAHESKAWLEFTPMIDGGVKLSSFEPVDLKAFLSIKMEEFKLRPVRPASLEGGIKDPLTRTAPKNNNNLINNEFITTLKTASPATHTQPNSINMENNGNDLKATICTQLRKSEGYRDTLANMATLFQKSKEELLITLKRLENQGIVYSPKVGVWKLTSSETGEPE